MQVDGALAPPSGDEDDGSLFGSPPSSPVRGRSPQLALPTGPGPTENVGTIALPGSHYHSELAIDPAVLLLNSQPPMARPSSPSPVSPTPPSIPPSSHRPSASRGSSRVLRKSQKGKDRSTTPRPPPPPIHLPDPDEPVPANFLRSQQALLGHAGLIGGLKPSTLSSRYHRGSTPRNPIVVEDQLNPPPLGHGSTPSFSTAVVSPPPSEEIISSLVKQWNIFPVLESLLRLLSDAGAPSPSPVAAASPSPPLSQASGDLNHESGPVPKRRRLNSVPAGAADWDVPYPFQQGEGPDQYRLHWERERLKQLLSQLMGVIKGAARSAAVRTHLQQQIDPYLATFSSSGLPQQNSGPAACPIDAQPRAQLYHPDIRGVTNIPSTSGKTSSQPSHAPTDVQQFTPFDNLISSMLSNAIPHTQPPFDLTSNASTSAATPHNTSSPDLQQLMSMLQYRSIQGLVGDDAPIPSRPSTPSPGRLDQASSSAPVVNTIPDSLIDPALLERSLDHHSQAIHLSGCPTPGQQEPSTPTLVQSPIASASSLFDPSTPREDFYSEPDVYRPEQEDPVGAAALLLQMAASARPQQAFQPKMQSRASAAPRGLNALSLPVPSAIPLPSFGNVTATVTPASSRASSIAPTQQTNVTPAITSTSQFLTHLDQRRLNRASATNKSLNKHESIRRAKERRRQLAAELEKAKVELWETTIEQGVLSHLAKDHGRL
ncbi:hypothetical protein BC834DRAFT_883046 [Gloeopeniophorella convolvens]|nr:hypothetical protein BC834DRAFT_883046 [Gloeopeniophorella convolvens]